MSRNLSHNDCQKSPDAPQNRCKCLAGKSKGTGIDIILIEFQLKYLLIKCMFKKILMYLHIRFYIFYVYFKSF